MRRRVFVGRSDRVLVKLADEVPFRLAVVRHLPFPCFWEIHEVVDIAAIITLNIWDNKIKASQRGPRFISDLGLIAIRGSLAKARTFFISAFWPFGTALPGPGPYK